MINSARVCDCELRQRAWNPNTGRCEWCSRKFEDSRSTGPSLAASKRKSSWDVVRSYVEQLRLENAPLLVGADTVLTLVSADLTYGAVDVFHIRDSLGMLGTDSEDLVKAYIVILESAAHLASEVEARGQLLTRTSAPSVAYPAQSPACEVKELCVSQIRAAIQLRVLLKERREGIKDAASGQVK